MLAIEIVFPVDDQVTLVDKAVPLKSSESVPPLTVVPPL
jgi:hypothetical protein